MKLRIPSLVAVIFLFCLSGCSIQKSRVSKPKEYFFQEEAVPHDVPLSLGAKNRAQKIFPNGIFQLSYFVNDSPLRVGSFYKDEMESLGWALASEFLTEEYALVFEKPRAQCHVFIRSVSDQQTQVSVKLKRDEELFDHPE